VRPHVRHELPGRHGARPHVREVPRGHRS
jgi:hypothetical protein